MEKDNQNPTLRLDIRVEKLKSDLKNKQKKLDDTQAQLERVISENEQLRKQLNRQKKPKAGYDSSRTWISKIVFILTNSDKPLRSAEIIALLVPKEPVLNEKASKEKFISPFLNSAMRYQRLIPFKLKGVRGNYYCLPEWMNDEHELLPEMRKRIY